jgi:hypothetical protein
MRLDELIEQVDGFDALTPRDRIRLFAWWLHTHSGVETFDFDAIRSCYKQLHIIPDEISVYVPRMAGYKPPDIIKERSGYKLARAVRTALDGEYGIHHSVVQVSSLLGDLPGKVPDLAEKNFLAEAIKCYRVAAYRACVVMTWNLAYSHLLHWILADAGRLSDFNTAIPKRFTKKAPITIAKYDDFEEMKESEVIEVCKSVNLVNGSLIRILREKLGKRNTAAHPASVVVVQSQADDVVTDLVNNVVLALK